jgi:hypothetical protein
MRISTEELLRDGMARIAEQVGVPAGLAARAHDRWQRGRRTRRLALLAGTGAAAGGMTAAIVAIGLAPGHGTRPARASTAPIVREVSAALDAASGTLVQYTRTTLPPGTGASAYVPPYLPGAQDNPRYTRPVFVERDYRGLTALGFYARPGAKIFAGRVAVAAGPRTTTLTTTWVAFANGTWWRSAARVRTRPPVPDIWCSRFPVGLAPGISDWASVVQHLLACRYVVVGRVPSGSGGQPAIRISQRATTANGSTSWSLWVSPVTHLPSRLTITYRHRQPWTTSFRWLAPTPANLAPFRLAIPPGFRQVAIPAG